MIQGTETSIEAGKWKENADQKSVPKELSCHGETDPYPIILTRKPIEIGKSLIHQYYVLVSKKDKESHQLLVEYKKDLRIQMRVVNNTRLRNLRHSYKEAVTYGSGVIQYKRDLTNGSKQEGLVITEKEKGTVEQLGMGIGEEENDAGAGGGKPRRVHKKLEKKHIVRKTCLTRSREVAEELAKNVWCKILFNRGRKWRLGRRITFQRRMLRETQTRSQNWVSQTTLD